MIKYITSLAALIGKTDNPDHINELKTYAAYQNCFLDKSGKLTNDGRLVLKDLYDIGLMEASTAFYDTNNRLDINAMAVNEGRRQAVIHVLKRIKCENLNNFNGEFDDGTDPDYAEF